MFDDVTKEISGEKYVTMSKILVFFKMTNDKRLNCWIYRAISSNDAVK